MTNKTPTSEFTYLYLHCRKQWSLYNKERRQCLNDARVKVPGSMPRWRCFDCKQFFAQSEVDVDHIYPIGTSTPKTAEEFITAFRKLYCPLSSLQILCLFCHNRKTQADRMKKREMEKKEKLAVHYEVIAQHVGLLQKDVARILADDEKLIIKLAKAIEKVNTCTDPDDLFKQDRKLAKLLRGHCLGGNVN